MSTLGTPLSPSATRVLLLGSGELGKEVAIELQRLGVEVIAADRYADAPAMQVAHRCARDRHAGRDGAARADRRRSSRTWSCPRSKPSTPKPWSQLEQERACA